MWTLIGAALACPEDPAAAIRARAQALADAYDAVDEARFADEYAGLHADAACVDAPLDRATVLAWHRSRALGEFFEREEIASAKSWAAIQVLDPAWAPPDGWILDGTPLHRAWSTAPTTPGRITLERRPAGGWRVDGEPSSTVPADRAFVLQGFDAKDEVVHTGYHFSVAEVPTIDWEALDATARQRRQRRMRAAGTGLGGVLGAAALGSLAIAAGEQRAVRSESTALAEVPVHAQRANAWSGVGVGLGVAGAGVGIAAWSVRW